ncbi:uncharacterized protein V1510DRAFT_404708 [Dipodascopsis tothii]|uniref:uncharacterized protein n=1 Tax=Dipodascopsis tothii TaxID=44089 RepID=UPI0034CF252E
MALARKFASLPDIDTLSPDVFETPDLVEDVAEDSSPEVVSPDIDQEHISADVARQRFLNRVLQHGTVERPPEPAPETLDARIQRLRREVEQVELEVELAGSASPGPTTGRLAERVRALAKEHRAGSGYAQAVAVLGAGPAVEPLPLAEPAATPTPTPPAVAPDALAAAEARLAALEHRVGRLAAPDAVLGEQPLMLAVQALQDRVAALAADPAELDAAVARANAAAAALKAAPEPSGEAAQVDALFRALPAVDSLAQTAPPLVDRLQSLATIHADAGHALTAFRDMDARVADTRARVERWHAAVAALDSRLADIELREKANLDAVQEWTAALEERLARLP